jgi:hypothetical protein
MHVGYERFFTGFTAPTIPMLDSDFRGIALTFQPPSESELKTIVANDDEFCPVPVMAARRQNRTRFMQLSKTIGLFLGSTASKLEDSDRMTILDPTVGTAKELDPAALARRSGVFWM